MKKERPKKSGFLWWFVLFSVLVVSIGFFLRGETGQESNPRPTAKTVPARAQKATQHKDSEATGKTAQVSLAIPKTPAHAEPASRDLLQESCLQIEQDVRAFFHYLDNQRYIQRLDPGISTFERFKEILKRLVCDPPIPAGEGVSPRIMTQNIYHFFRALNLEDLRLAEAVIQNEQDTMEINLAVFYKWLTLDRDCPNPDGIRPPLKILYRYAGFFLNTIGGRAYLFRRDPGIRLLISYYSLLIVHRADVEGRNSYGIDIFPLLSDLITEMAHYADFRFQNEYIHKLHSLRAYYLGRR